MFKRLKQQLVYQDPWLKVFKDDIQFPDGSIGTYAWTQRKPGVVVVIVNPENRIFLNNAYRYVIETTCWEIPGGGIDDGESPEVAAKREVFEECGLKLTSLDKLGELYPLSGFNSEKVTMFMSKTMVSKANKTGLESGESVVGQGFFSPSEIISMIESGEIKDSLTTTAVLLAIRKLTT